MNVAVLHGCGRWSESGAPLDLTTFPLSDELAPTDESKFQMRWHFQRIIARHLVPRN